MTIRGRHPASVIRFSTPVFLKVFKNRFHFWHPDAKTDAGCQNGCRMPKWMPNVKTDAGCQNGCRMSKISRTTDQRRVPKTEEFGPLSFSFILSVFFSMYALF
jgi:hypothetical protein